MENMDDEVEQRCYAIRTNDKLGLTVNPHPIIEEDIIDCNGEVEDDLESSLDDHQRLNSILAGELNLSPFDHLTRRLKNEYKELIILSLIQLNCNNLGQFQQSFSRV